MKHLIATTLAALLLVPAAGLAQSAFNGTWKIDTSKVQAPKKPYTVVLKDGMFSCKTCKPPYSIKADGAFHPIKGHPDVDEEAVTVVDDHTVKSVDRNDGKVVGRDTSTISPDGKTKTVDFTNASKGGPVTGKYTAMRVAKGPAGSHATSGSWRIQKYSDVSDNLRTMSYKVQGDVLHMHSGTGESYSAKMDGSDAPMTGSDTTTSVSVTKKGPRSLRVVYRYQGKPTGESTRTVSADGNTLHIVNHNLKTDTTMRLVADKQSGMDDAAGGGMASVMAPDGKPAAGTYASSANGRTTMITFAGDGTYTARENGKVLESGIWSRDANDNVCLNPEDGATRCYSDSKPAADGTWKATRIGQPDDVYTIRRKG